MKSIDVSRNEDIQANSHNPIVRLIFSSAKIFRFTNLFTFLVFAAIAFGWRIRNEYWFTAESGLGYWLGICGGSMMLLLLLYPLKKRLNRNPFFVLSTKNWFKLHMMFGVMGPLLILFHCNFRLGSTNSNITLVSMILMVVSGLIGRFIYGKIHTSLFGKKLHIKDLQEQRNTLKEQLERDVGSESLVFEELYRYGQKISEPKSVAGNFVTMICLSFSSRKVRINSIKNLKRICLSKNHLKGLDRKARARIFHSTKLHINQYLASTRKIPRLSFYERLFSMWHILHLPIFFMLIVTAFIHIYAVHVY